MGGGGKGEKRIQPAGTRISIVHSTHEKKEKEKKRERERERETALLLYNGDRHEKTKDGLAHRSEDTNVHHKHQ